MVQNSQLLVKKAQKAIQKHQAWWQDQLHSLLILCHFQGFLIVGLAKHASYVEKSEEKKKTPQFPFCKIYMLGFHFYEKRNDQGIEFSQLNNLKSQLKN